MKKVFAVLLALALLCSFVGCAVGEKTPPSTTEKDTSSIDKNTDAENNGDAPAEEIVINYRTFRVDDKDVMNQLIEKFETENEGITVHYTAEADENAYYQKLQADLLSGQDIDVFDVHLRTEFFSYQRNGYLADLSDLSFNANYDDSAKGKTSVDGKNYGYIPCVNALPIFYNKTLFAEMNITPPTTYAELVEVVNASREAGYGGISYPGATVGGTWLGKNAMIINLGADGLYNWWGGIDDGTVKSIDATVGNAMSYVAKVKDDKILFDNSDAISYDQAIALFAQGMSSMMMMGTWDLCNLDTTYADVDVGIFPLPIADGEIKVYAESGQITCAYAKSANVEAAKKFVDFLAAAENAQTYMEFAKSIPTIAGVVVDSEAGHMIDELLQGRSMEILPGIGFDNVDVWNGTVDNMYRELLYGNQSTMELFAQFEQIMTKAALDQK